MSFASARVMPMVRMNRPNLFFRWAETCSTWAWIAGFAALAGEIAVRLAKRMEQLSGLAVLDHGKDALVSVEGRHDAALVRLRDGKVIHVFKGEASNRRIVVAGH
jgi:hypothetical protein